MKSLKNKNIDFPGTHAVGKDAIALGYATKTSNNYEVALGMMNKTTSSFEGTPTLFSVGCGSNNERKNAIEVKRDGTTEFMGVGTIQSIEKRLKAVEKGGGGGGGGNYLPLEEGGKITMEDADTYHEILYKSDEINGPLLSSGTVVGYAINKNTLYYNNISLYSDANHTSLTRQTYSKYTTTYSESGVGDHTNNITKIAFMNATSNGSAEVTAKRANGVSRIISSYGQVEESSGRTFTAYEALQLIKDSSSSNFSDFDISLMRCGDEVAKENKAALEFVNYMTLNPFSLSFKDYAVYGDDGVQLTSKTDENVWCNYRTDGIEIYSNGGEYYIHAADDGDAIKISADTLQLFDGTHDECLFTTDGNYAKIVESVGRVLKNATINYSIPTTNYVEEYVASATPNITAGDNVTVADGKISVSTESSITDNTSTTAIPTVGAVKTYIVDNSSLRHLKILIIGNSYSQDSWCYLPFMLKNYNITISVGIAYRGGATLQQHAESWTTNSTTFYYIDTRTDSAWKTIGTYSPQNTVKYTDWDIILMQQQSTASVTESTYQPYAHTIVGYILDDATKPVKLGWNININPASAGDDYTAIAKQILANIKTVTDAEPVNFIAPYGTAVFNARTNKTLAAIGDGGNLWYSDKLHLQEGLPCYLANLTSMQALFDMFYPWLSVLGEPTRPTQTMINTWGVPGQNGTCTGVSDATCRLAQYCAVAANKDKFNITAIDADSDTPDPEPQPSETEDLTNNLIQGFITSNSGQLYYEGGSLSSPLISKYVIGTQAGSADAAAFSIDDDVRITIPAGMTYRVRGVKDMPVCSSSFSTSTKDLTQVVTVTEETTISTADFKDACTSAGLLYWNANLGLPDSSDITPAQAIEKGVKIIKYNS